MHLKKPLRSTLIACLLSSALTHAQQVKSSYCDNQVNGTPPANCDPIVVGEGDIRFSLELSGHPIDKSQIKWSVVEENGNPVTPGKEAVLKSDSKVPGQFIALGSGTAKVRATTSPSNQTFDLLVPVFTLGKIKDFAVDPIPIPLKPYETYHLTTHVIFQVGNTTKTLQANDKVAWGSTDPLDYDRFGNITTRADIGNFKMFAVADGQSKAVDVQVIATPIRPTPAYDDHAPALTKQFYASFIGGVEQVDLSSLPSQTEPFVRAYFQSGETSFRRRGRSASGLNPYAWRKDVRLWAAIRLLGSPDQGDTKGIFSVFADPTGQIVSQKFSSVGTAIDFAFGPAFRFATFADSKNSFDLFFGFGATTPLQSNKVTQAFVVPDFGTAECNILGKKFGAELARDQFRVEPSKDGVATGSTSACLLNKNAVATTAGVSTYQPIKTLAFSNEDKTGFFLKDMVGLRLNHTVQTGSGSCGDSDVQCPLGVLDFSFGQDAAITGGVLRGNLWTYKVDGVYPVSLKDVATFYIFGSFATRLTRGNTDNTPLILQPAAISTLTGTGVGSVPNPQTVVLPLSQPDRDFYRIGVGIDVLSLVKRKTADNK